MSSFDSINISFIGAGKAGVTLGAYFRSKGLSIGGYISRNEESSRSAAEITGSRVFNNMEELLENSGGIFITTPDDSIEEIWDQISRCNIKGKIICHASGLFTSEIFAGIGESGAYGYSVHPMYPFANKDGSYTGLEKAYFTIEGDEHCLNDLRMIFSGIGNRTIVIDRESKTLYHISNVMVSNLVLALVSIGTECLGECGVGEDESLDALLPLIMGNIENIKRKGLINSLTGPAERNDTGTVRKHLDVLPDRHKYLYKILTQRLVELSGKRHPERNYSELLNLLE